MNVLEQGPSIAIAGEEGLYHRELITVGVPFAAGALKCPKPPKVGHISKKGERAGLRDLGIEGWENP